MLGGKYAECADLFLGMKHSIAEENHCAEMPVRFSQKWSQNLPDRIVVNL